MGNDPSKFGVGSLTLFCRGLLEAHRNRREKTEQCRIGTVANVRELVSF